MKHIISLQDAELQYAGSSDGAAARRYSDHNTAEEQEEEEERLAQQQQVRTKQKKPPAAASAGAGAAGMSLQQVPEWDYFLQEEVIRRYHTHDVGDGECTSMVVQRVRAPIDVVWSTVRRFDKPQSYKHFIKSCEIRRRGGVRPNDDDDDDVGVGSVRYVRLVSGLPASCSTERLELLDDENHVLSFRVLGGEHRLRNYRSVTSLHQLDNGGGGGGGGGAGGLAPTTFVVESYVVPIPDSNSPDDTITFVDTVIRCNLQSLARLSERRHRQTAAASA